MKKNKIIAVILAAMLTASLFTACNNSDTSSDTGSTASISSSAQSTEAGENTAETSDSSSKKSDSGSNETSSTATEEKEMFTDRDLSGEYDETNATTVTCKDKTFTVKGDGAKATDNVLTISEEGTYIISGTVTDGRIVVEADEKAKVQIVLKDCSITSSDYSALYVKSADKVFLTLADGTNNTISDGKTYKEDSEESNVDSAIFSKTTLTINGTGSLTVNGNMSHAIVSKDNLKIASGTITVNSAGSAICGKDSVRIADGTINVTSGGDGIKATNTEKEDKGYVYIGGGKLTITKSYEGIEGSNITVSGGEIDVTASDDGMNAGGGSDQSAMGGRPGQNSFTADSDVFLKITGGTIKVNAGGDGLDSNNTLTIEGGTIYVDGPTDSGNGALDYDGTATISGGTLVAVGSSGMAESFSEDSKQASILYCMSESHNAGEKITLTDESGKELVSYTAAKTFNAVNISTPELKSSGKYTLKVGDSSYEIEMTSNSYSNGGGMMQQPNESNTANGSTSGGFNSI